MRESFQLDGGDQTVSSGQLQAVETIRHLFPETWQMNQLTVVRYKSSLEKRTTYFNIPYIPHAYLTLWISFHACQVT